MLSSTSVFTLAVALWEPFFMGVSERVRFLLWGPKTASSMSLETTDTPSWRPSSVLRPLCANRDSEERVVRLVDSKAVVVFMAFEVSRDIRDVRIVNVKG